MHTHFTYHHTTRDLEYPLQVITEAQTGSVSLSSAKDFFKEDRSVEDALIRSLVNASENTLKNFTGYDFIDTVYQMDLEGFVDFKVPKAPFKTGSMTIKYDDDTGTEQTLATNKYTIYEQEDPAEVEFEADLPALKSDKKFPVRVTFTIGYGAVQSSVPDEIQTAIKLLALIYWKRGIPEDERSNLNPLNIRVLKSLIGDRRIGRFK